MSRTKFLGLPTILVLALALLVPSLVQSTVSAEAAVFDDSQVVLDSDTSAPGSIIASQTDLSGGPPGPTFLVTWDVRAFDAIGQSITTPPAIDHGYDDPGGGFDKAITSTMTARGLWLVGAGAGDKVAAGESFAGQQFDGVSQVDLSFFNVTGADPGGGHNLVTIDDGTATDYSIEPTITTVPGTSWIYWADGDTNHFLGFAGQGSTAYADVDVTRYSVVGLLLATLILGIIGRSASMWRNLVNYMIAFQQTPTLAFAGQESRRAPQNDHSFSIGSTFSTGRRQAERARHIVFGLNNMVIGRIRSLAARATEGTDGAALQHDLVSDPANQLRTRSS